MTTTLKVGPDDELHKEIVALAQKLYEQLRAECEAKKFGPDIGVTIASAMLANTLFCVHSTVKAKGKQNPDEALMGCFGAALNTITNGLQANGLDAGFETSEVRNVGKTNPNGTRH